MRKLPKRIKLKYNPVKIDNSKPWAWRYAKKDAERLIKVNVSVGSIGKAVSRVAEAAKQAQIGCKAFTEACNNLKCVKKQENELTNSIKKHN